MIRRSPSKPARARATTSDNPDTRSTRSAVSADAPPAPIVTILSPSPQAATQRTLSVHTSSNQSTGHKRIGDHGGHPSQQGADVPGADPTADAMRGDGVLDQAEPVAQRSEHDAGRGALAFGPLVPVQQHQAG